MDLVSYLRDILRPQIPLWMRSNLERKTLFWTKIILPCKLQTWCFDWVIANYLLAILLSLQIFYNSIFDDRNCQFSRDTLNLEGLVNAVVFSKHLYAYYCKIECNLMMVITCNYHPNNGKPKWTLIAEIQLSLKIQKTKDALSNLYTCIISTKYINILINWCFNWWFVISYSYVST